MQISNARKWRPRPNRFQLAIDWDLRFGDQLEYLEEMAAADDGPIPHALEIKPDLDELLQFYREAFWILCRAMPITGGGMTAAHIEPMRIADIFAIAEGFGFDPLHFLRVITPAHGLYIQSVAARLNK